MKDEIKRDPFAIENVIEDIKTRLDCVAKKGKKLKGNAAWTKKIKRRLAECGTNWELNGHALTICATRPHPNIHETICGWKWNEWLYDLCWLEDDENDHIFSMPLAMECEWNPDFNQILPDFLKLVVSKATLRVMIFQKNNAKGIGDTFDALMPYMGTFRHRCACETYLLCGYNYGAGKRAGKFDFRVVRDAPSMEALRRE